MLQSVWMLILLLFRYCCHHYYYCNYCCYNSNCFCGFHSSLENYCFCSSNKASNVYSNCCSSYNSCYFPAATAISASMVMWLTTQRKLSCMQSFKTKIVKKCLWIEFTYFKFYGKWKICSEGFLISQYQIKIDVVNRTLSAKHTLS